MSKVPFLVGDVIFVNTCNFTYSTWYGKRVAPVKGHLGTLLERELNYRRN